MKEDLYIKMVEILLMKHYVKDEENGGLLDSPLFTWHHSCIVVPGKRVDTEDCRKKENETATEFRINILELQIKVTNETTLQH